MRLGVTYDTGFTPGGVDSRSGFEAATAADEMAFIAHDLGAAAVRVTGSFPDRIETAATAAARVGLDVWFSPFPCELDPAATLTMLLDCADRAERLRRTGADVTLVLGCELSMFGRGYLPGGSVHERIAAVRDAGFDGDLSVVRRRLDDFLAAAAVAARPRFGGPLTYAAGLWEDVDWTPFDIVGLDAYRDADNAASFVAGLRCRVGAAPTLAVTEFGCCTFTGAGRLGGMGWAVVDRTTGRLEPWVRYDEHEQVTYLRECTRAFVEAGVDIAFWFTFAGFGGAVAADYGLVRSHGRLDRKAVADEFTRLARTRRTVVNRRPA